MTSRPVVTVDGTETTLLARQLAGLAVRERRRHPGRLRLQLVHTPDLLHDPQDGQGLRLGAAVGVTLGRGGTGWRFEGIVYAVTVHCPPDTAPLLVVDAEDALARLRTEARDRVWRSVSESDLVAQIAGEHGLAAQVDDGPGVHRHLRQAGASDLDFLRARAEALGHDLWVRGQTLHQGPPGQRSSAALTLRLGQELLSASARTDRAGGGEHAGGELRTRVTGQAAPTPDLGVGCTLTLTGVAPWVDGRPHRVTAARHTYDEQGLRTHFRAGPD